MNNMRRWCSLILGVLPILLSACGSATSNTSIELPQRYRLPQSSLSATLEHRSGRIAIIDDTGNVVVMDQTGGNAVKITRDAAAQPSQGQFQLMYRWPVWSPDTNEIAFVEVTSQSSTQTVIMEYGVDSVTIQRGDNAVTVQHDATGSTMQRSPNTTDVIRSPYRITIEPGSNTGSLVSSAIYVARSDGKSPLKEVYMSANATVPYLDWAPDSSQIAFLSQANASETDLNLVSVDSERPRKVVSGYSVFYQWSPDSNALLTNIGTSATRTSADSLSLLDAHSNKTTLSIVSDTDLPFRSPHYSPDGNYILMTVKVDDKQYLALADRQGKVLKQLLPFTGLISFAWAPTGARVAYMVEESLDTPGGALHVLDVNSGEDKVLSNVPVVAFFWSPNGQRIAAFSPARASDITTDFPGLDLTDSSPSVVFMLQTIDMTTRGVRQLAYFEPTADFQRFIGVFDQFSRSMTIWSPDSQRLVFPLTYNNGQTTSNYIFETEATGSVDPRMISQGTLAFWSPK